MTDTKPANLRDLRLQSKLSLDAISKRMSDYDGRPPRSRTVIFKFEERGTRNIDVLRAFAHAYDMSLEEIDQLARQGFDKEANKLTSDC